MITVVTVLAIVVPVERCAIGIVMFVTPGRGTVIFFVWTPRVDWRNPAALKRCASFLARISVDARILAAHTTLVKPVEVMSGRVRTFGVRGHTGVFATIIVHGIDGTFAGTLVALDELVSMATCLMDVTDRVRSVIVRMMFRCRLRRLTVEISVERIVYFLVVALMGVHSIDALALSFGEVEMLLGLSLRLLIAFQVPSFRLVVEAKSVKARLFPDACEIDVSDGTHVGFLNAPKGWHNVMAASTTSKEVLLVPRRAWKRPLLSNHEGV